MKLSVGVQKAGLGELKNEPSGDVASTFDGDRRLFEHRSGVIYSARRHQVVERNLRGVGREGSARVPGRANASRLSSARTSEEMANMPTILSRTSASCSGGSA